MSKATNKAWNKFKRIRAINEDIDEGGDVGIAARKMHRKLSDSWSKRNSNNTQGFFDRKKAREMKRNAA